MHALSSQSNPEGILHLFDQVCNEWGIEIPLRVALLGEGPSFLATYQSWVEKAKQRIQVPLDEAMLDRVSIVVGSYAAAIRVWGTPDGARFWLMTPSSAPEFGNQRPLDCMLQGIGGLQTTWAYISAIANETEVP